LMAGRDSSWPLRLVRSWELGWILLAFETVQILKAGRKPLSCQGLYCLQNWEVSSRPSILYKSWRPGGILLNFETVHSLEGWEYLWYLPKVPTCQVQSLVPILVENWTGTQVQTNNL
jgi:hypothetical protein